MYNPGEIRDRIGFYSVEGTPRLFVDGVIDCGNAPELWQPHVEDRIPISSPIQMSIAGYFDPDSLSGQITVTVYAEDDPGALNLRLRIALTESGIYYQAPNGSTLHNYIFRDMIPSTEGEELEISQGETKYSTFPFFVPAPLNADSCTLVAYVQSDQTREIMQAARIRISDLNSTTGVETEAEIPGKFDLAQNYPNPFNSNTEIGFFVETGRVEVAIYDITGSLVKTLFRGDLTSGPYSLEWDGRDNSNLEVCSGIYFYGIKNRDKLLVKKMTFLK
jgi:hypothetical protein